MNRKKKDSPELVKGILVGVLLSTDILRDRFNKSFAKSLDSVEPPLISILEYEIVTKFFDDNAPQFEELLIWVDENYDRLFNHVDRSYFRYLIETLLKKTIPKPPHNLNLNLN